MRPIRSLISSEIQTRAKTIQSMTASVHSRLAQNLREHCWVIGVIGNKLVMITDNAERATRLRYQQHELLKQVNEEFSNTLNVPLRRLRVKVDFNLSKSADMHKTSIYRPALELEKAKKHCQAMLKLLE